MTHTEWIEKVAGEDSGGEISRKSGIAPRTIAHQVKHGHFPAENVIAIAIAYGVHPVGALVETGYLDEKYARQIDPSIAVRLLDDERFVAEILRRMKISSTDLYDTPIDELLQSDLDLAAPHEAEIDKSTDHDDYA